MFNQAKKTASAVGFGLLAILILDGHSLGIAHADECRASPGAQTPPGGHWRYRTEKSTGKKCWYLTGDTNRTETVTQSQPASDSDPSAQPATPKQKPSHMQPSVANARAELATSDPAQSALAESTWPPMSEVNAVNAAQESATTQDQQPASQQNLVMAQRWPTPVAAASSDPQSQAAQTQNQAQEQAQLQLRAAARDAQQSAAPASQPAATPVQNDTESDPVRILLVAAIGALALIAILLRTIIGYVHRRKPRAQRRPHWHDAIPLDRRPVLSAQRSMPAQPQRFARNIPEDEHDEIEHLLRRAQN